MFTNVVVIDLQTLQDGPVKLLQASHCLFSVSDFAVHPFHLVIVVVALQSNMIDMSDSRPSISIKFC